MHEFLLYMIPFIAAASSTFVFEKFQALLGMLDKLPPGVKRAISAGLSYGLNLAGLKVGVAVGFIDATTLTQEQATALLSGAMGFVFHTQNKLKGSDH